MALFSRRKSEGGPDGFPTPEGPTRAVHERISGLLREFAAAKSGWNSVQDLAPLAGWKALSSAPREEQREVAAALGDRLRWQREVPLTSAQRSEDHGQRPYDRLNVEILLEALLRRDLSLSWEELGRILDGLETETWRAGAWTGAVRAAEALARSGPPPTALRGRLVAGREALARRGTREHRALVGRIDAVLGEARAPALSPGAPWADLALADLERMDPATRDRWAALLGHAADSSSSKPKEAWLREARRLVVALGVAGLAAHLPSWFERVDSPGPVGADISPEGAPVARWLLVPQHEDVLRGLAWACSLEESAALARGLGRLALAGLRKVPGRGPRSIRLVNASVYALGEMPGRDALGQLAVLQVKAKHRPTLRQIEKALAAVAERLGLPREELDELGVPTYGLDEVGVRRSALGDGTAELRVTGTSSTEITWLEPSGKRRKSPPAAVRAGHAEELAELKGVAKDLQRMVPAQRDRIDRLALERKTWPLAAWRERYLDHPVVGVVARRLIWRLVPAEGASGETRSFAWREGGLVDADDRSVVPSAGARVELWHPLHAGPDEVRRWRAWIAAQEVVQPFKQAHREIYPLTPAEQTTRIYSNRYAAHLVRQHQFHALCLVRGWRDALRLCVDAFVAPPSLELPKWNLRAEFWVEGAGEYGEDTNETGTYLRLATDQVRFYRAGTQPSEGHAGGGGFQSRGDAVPLEEVPPLVFSEVMRDVDLFVGVSSVGNDPTWADGGPGGRAVEAWRRFAFGELAESAKTRKEVLEGLIPRLAIRDRCTLRDRFLVVRGDRRTYKIHLGSGNILMEPDDAYLCIVAPPSAKSERIHLPFEGDSTLSLILSKAILLAADTSIRDETILHQIADR